MKTNLTLKDCLMGTYGADRIYVGSTLVWSRDYTTDWFWVKNSAETPADIYIGVFGGDNTDTLSDYTYTHLQGGTVNDSQLYVDLEYSTDRINWTGKTKTLAYTAIGNDWLDVTGMKIATLGAGEKVWIRNLKPIWMDCTSFVCGAYIWASYNNWMKPFEVGGKLSALYYSQSDINYVRFHRYISNSGELDIDRVYPTRVSQYTGKALGCFEKMFSRSNLQTIPSVIHTNTVGTENEYLSMYLYSSHIGSGAEVEIPETSIAKRGLDYAFDGAPLASIRVSFTEWPTWVSGGSTLNSTSAWVDGQGSTGTFYKPSALPEIYGVSYIPTGWTVVNY